MLTVETVSEACQRSRGGGHGSWPWTRKMLAQADAQFHGAWREAAISGHDALDIMLPPHAGEPCKGDQLTLVGAHGATVRDAAAALAKLGAAYARNNPSCAERIGFAADAPFSHIVLCTSPLQWEEYADVAAPDGARCCVDGFHRLVSWAAAGRLTSEAQLNVWIAG